MEWVSSGEREGCRVLGAPATENAVKGWGIRGSLAGNAARPEREIGAGRVVPNV